MTSLFFSWLTPFRASWRRQVCSPSAPTNFKWRALSESVISHTWSALIGSWAGCSKTTNARKSCRQVFCLLDLLWEVGDDEMRWDPELHTATPFTSLQSSTYINPGMNLNSILLLHCRGRRAARTDEFWVQTPAAASQLHLHILWWRADLAESPQLRANTHETPAARGEETKTFASKWSAPVVFRRLY